MIESMGNGLKLREFYYFKMILRLIKRKLKMVSAKNV